MRRKEWSSNPHYCSVTDGKSQADTEWIIYLGKWFSIIDIDML